MMNHPMHLHGMKQLGQTTDFAKDEGEDTSDVQIIAGIRPGFDTTKEFPEMKKQFLIVLLLPVALFGLAGCENSGDTGTTDVGSSDMSLSVLPERSLQLKRWYSETQVARGDNLFQVNCAICHKPDASGTTKWRERDAKGFLPPPPLNGTAHAWHHPLSVLRRTVRLGGVRLGGTMPGFADKLNPEEIDAILAWVQSHWSDEIYRIWHERNVQASKPLQPIKKG